MRFVRNDVKNDHGLSYWRYAASQRRTCPKINFCEIFGVFRFSTFSTVSATSGLIDNANKTVFQLTIQKRARRIFAAQVERSTCVTYSRYNLPFYRHF